MKKTLLYSLAFLLLVLFSNCKNVDNQNDNTNEKTESVSFISKDAKINVFYFHGTNRCVTCNAVESNALELLNQDFKDKLDDGTIYFNSFNIDEKENKAIAEKYLISYSTLLIITLDSEGKEVVNDLTDMAFQYAKNQPDKYKELLKNEIDELLK